MSKAFAQHISAAPIGFHSSCQALNQAAALEDVFADTLLDVLRFLKSSKREVTVAHVAERANGRMREEHVARFLDCSRFILQACVRHKPAPETLASTLSSYTSLSDGAIEGLVRAWQQYDSLAADAAQAAHLLQVGQLVGLDWRLGVAMSSSACTSLMTPYVKLTFRIADGSGVTSVHGMELTYAEFQEMQRTFKDVLQTLEMV